MLDHRDDVHEHDADARRQACDTIWWLSAARPWRPLGGDNGARLCQREPVMVDVVGDSLHRDRFYPPIKEVVSVILQSSDVVAPIDVLIGLEVITPELRSTNGAGVSFPIWSAE
ncbi:MAG: hypothetical protein QM820_06160 [Minicystis sp.]